MILAFCWCAGLLLGCFCARQTSDIHFPLMHRAAESSVSIVGLVAVLLPFLLSAFAVLSSLKWVILPLCFAKAFSFSFTASLISSAFASAGWLLRMMLLFTDSITLPVLLLFWFRSFDDSDFRLSRTVFLCLTFLIFVMGIDYCMVAPFLASIL
jgi:hypothetical protein